MKAFLSAYFVIHSVAAFATPFPFGGPRPSPSFAAAAALQERNDNRNTCLSATPQTVVDSKPSVIDADNWNLLSLRGQAALARLIDADAGVGAQTHVYADWPPAGTEDDGKKKLTEQVRRQSRSDG
jgi:hypothetical protein